MVPSSDVIVNIPEQITVKAHPALSEGEGGGGGEGEGQKKIEEHFPEASA